MEDGLGDLFDHIEDLLDFPDDVLGLAEPCGHNGGLLLPSLPVPAANGLPGGVGDDALHGFTTRSNNKFSGEEHKLGSCDELDIVQLEWMSKFLDDSDSFSLDLPSCDGINNNANGEDNGVQTKARGHHSFFRTSSPVSVLEADTIGGGGGGDSYSSSSSSSSTSASYSNRGNDTTILLPPLSPPEPPSVLVVPARARSKRPRPATFSPRHHVAAPYLPPSSDAVPVPNPLSAATSSDPESIGESCPAPPPPKKKKSKKKSPATAATADGEESGPPPPVRKCMHCEIQKTPQWRAGPMGPKTLCNACGVRYKSGRLFPEYRPAASPTFVPSIHSNSHPGLGAAEMEAAFQDGKEEVLQAWYMDDSEEDQRLPHHREPKEFISLGKLKELGIVSWRLNPDDYENDGNLKKIREARGYSYMDICDVCPEKLPNYEAKLKSFFEEHLHTDEEIRYCLEGSGYFDARDKSDRWIRIAVKKGGMIVLPAGIYHRFTLDTNNYIKAMRLFVGEPVWTPFNRPHDDLPARKAYLETFVQNELGGPAVEAQ